MSDNWEKGLEAALGGLQPWSPSQRDPHPLTAEPDAIEDSRICQLGVEDVERYLISDPRIAIRISRLPGEQVARLEERLTDLALRPLPARAASILIRLDAAAPGGRREAPHRPQAMPGPDGEDQPGGQPSPVAATTAGSPPWPLPAGRHC